MEKLYEYLRGTARVEITGAQPEKFLSACAGKGIEFWDCDPGDGYTMRITMYAGDYAKAERLAGRCMCSAAALKSSGGKKLLRAIRRRRVLAALIAAFIFLISWSSLYIWDMDVEGNSTVTDGEILRVLEENGVGIGTYWPGISNDMLRAGALPELKEISWLAVNVKSSHAVVKVKERTDKPELAGEDTPTNVKASKTGIITKMSVLQGKPVLEPGNAVVEGETIVSGAMDSKTNGTRAVHALADVEAHTLYELTAVCPDTQWEKTEKTFAGRRFALLIGKKRINFYRDSGKSRADCDKIIKTMPVSVKGVFTLPITLINETFVRYEPEEAGASPEDRLKENLMAGLKERMLPGGEVLSSTYAVNRSGGLVTVTLRAECLENIGRTVPMTQEELDAINLANLNSKEGKDE